MTLHSLDHAVMFVPSVRGLSMPARRCIAARWSSATAKAFARWPILSATCWVW